MVDAERGAMPADIVRLIEWHGTELDRADFERLHRPAHDRTVRLLRAVIESYAEWDVSVLDGIRLATAMYRCWYECSVCGLWMPTRLRGDVEDGANQLCAHQDGCHFGARTSDRFVPVLVGVQGKCDRVITFSRRLFDGPVIIPALHPHPLERGRLYRSIKCDVCFRPIAYEHSADALSCHVCYLHDVGLGVGFDACAACAAAAVASAANTSK